MSERLTERPNQHIIDAVEAAFSGVPYYNVTDTYDVEDPYECLAIGARLMIGFDSQAGKLVQIHEGLVVIVEDEKIESLRHAYARWWASEGSEISIGLDMDTGEIEDFSPSPSQLQPADLSSKFMQGLRGVMRHDGEA